MDYKQTLNLPKTDMPMRANLANVEQEFLGYWKDTGIYQKMLEKNKDKKHYILHDGPPYANGHIHLGHAINRILKDIVVKYKTMAGFYTPFIPGWDCHGLPIETQLLKELGNKRKDMNTLEFRKGCHDYAMKFVGIQREESIHLGVLGDWYNPYLTLDPIYEEKVIEVFGKLADNGYIYRGLKPIHWCPKCRTALAEAEIEYSDERSPSIFVKFKVKDIEQLKANKKSPLHNLDLPIYFIIWTTTPWTLPANVAIAAHPKYEYVFLKVGEEIWIVAEGLLNALVEKLNLKEHKIIDKTNGEYLEGIVCQHPFLDRESMLVLDEYVTLEQGTGLVHIAPGHGIEDYQVGLKYKLPIVMPVDEKGYFDDTVGEFSGKYYDESNKLITQRLDKDGNLVKLEFMKHSYPHCWRCKKPVIFRATEQWFVSVDHDHMRDKALKAIGDTNWIPSWGENRIRGMVETRPDWCISRQRSWGVPIPAFYCNACGKVHFKGKFNESARALIKKEGTDGWFAKEPKDFLPEDLRCECGRQDFRKETDILDVWFESGSSHAAVLETRKELRWPASRLGGPADLYLEGSDQHRGWFQSSLLTSIGYKGRAPFNSVLTHGFTVDDKGKKMSKSLGNVVAPLDVVKKYGADVLRLWVASTDFRNDMAASDKILKQVQDAYLKIRNTCRFLISNLYDYDNGKDKVEYEQLLEIDKWALLKLHKLIEKVDTAYQGFEFHVVYHSVLEFCVNDLSAFFLDLSKDRLYCDRPDAPSRRSAQTVMHEVLLSLIKLLAPVLSFTCESILKFVPELALESIFLAELPLPENRLTDKGLEEKWERIFAARERVYKRLEEARSKKEIASSTEASVSLVLDDKDFEALCSIEKELAMVFIVSDIKISKGKENIKVSHSSEKKCERCWQWKNTVGKNAIHPTLCERCSGVVAG